MFFNRIVTDETPTEISKTTGTPFTLIFLSIVARFWMNLSPCSSLTDPNFPGKKSKCECRKCILNDMFKFRLWNCVNISFTYSEWPLDRENREMTGKFVVDREFFKNFNKKRFQLFLNVLHKVIYLYWVGNKVFSLFPARWPKSFEVILLHCKHQTVYGIWQLTLHRLFSKKKSSKFCRLFIVLH